MVKPSAQPDHMHRQPALSSRREVATRALILALLVAAAYLPAMRAGYIWDDDSYLTRNPTLTQPGGLGRIWLEPAASPQYYPLVFSSFWVEHRLWSSNPAGYHIVNVLLHLANAFLLWLLLVRVGFPAAWVVAAIFALHPLQVESVAWITERKNVLSGCFYLLAAVVYLPLLDAGDGRGGSDRTRARTLRARWAAALLLFIFALLSKSVTATLPVALLLLVWWRRGSLNRADLARLAPFVAIGAASGIFTAWLERSHVGARGAGWSFTLDERLVIAGKNFWFSLAKCFWPHPLIFTYPRWEPHGYPWWHLAAPVAAVALVLLLWRHRPRIGNGPLAATVFFVVTLAPALGFVDFYPMRFSFAADHFLYLSIIGPVILVVGAAAAVLSHARATRPSRDDRSRRVAVVALSALLLLLAALTWSRSLVFRNEETLWRDTLAKNPGATSARVNLGVFLARRGDYPEALQLLQNALAQEPTAVDILTILGSLYDALQRPKEAEESYRAALRIDPNAAVVHLELGRLLARRGSLSEAEEQFRRALTPDSAGAAARYNLGMIMDARGEHSLAVNWYRDSLRLAPNDAETHNNLGVDLALLGRRDEAAHHFREALRARPGYREAAASLEALNVGDAAP